MQEVVHNPHQHLFVQIPPKQTLNKGTKTILEADCLNSFLSFSHSVSSKSWRGVSEGFHPRNSFTGTAFNETFDEKGAGPTGVKRKLSWGSAANNSLWNGQPRKHHVGVIFCAGSAVYFAGFPVALLVCCFCLFVLLGVLQCAFRLCNVAMCY